MAIPINPSMYSGGAVTLDSQPVVNMYAQLLARKQAKFDAMDAYQRDRIGKVNDKGLRDVDRHLFDNSLADIYGTYTTNKDKILKGGNKESFEYEAKWRTPKEILSKSQVSQATHEAAMKLYNERFKKKDVMPKGFMEELALNDLPVNDPNYKLFDLKKWMEEPPPLNTTAFLKNFSDIEREGVRYEGIPDKPLMQNEIKYFKDKGLDAIRFRAANIRDEDYGFATQIEKEYEDPIGRKKMIDVFTKAYGTPPATMDDYAAAFTLEMLQLEKGTPKENKEATIALNQANRKEIQAIGHKNSLARLYVNASLQDRKPEAMGRNIDGLIAGHIADARDNGGVVVTDAETYKSITGQNKLSSSVLMVDEAGNYKYGKKNENGEFVVTGEIPLDAAKIKLTKTYKSGLDSRYNTGNVKPPASTIPTYSKSDLIKAGWTEDQIKQAVNAKKIKVN